MTHSDHEKAVLRDQIKQHKANLAQALNEGFTETAGIIQGHIDRKERLVR